MIRSPQLLVVDDDEIFRDTLADQLSRHFPDIRKAASAGEGIGAVETAEPDVVLLDLNLGDADGLDALQRILSLAPTTEVIVVTGFGTVDAAVEAMRRGAFDFVTKPLQVEPLVATIERAAERRDLRRRNEGMRRMLEGTRAPTLVGSSAAMREVRDTTERAARADASVLITGPSGCGKEVVARLIHAHSARSARELVVVNAAALQENLLESELFGHERGAFTGAVEQRPGLIEAADGGTLFLDEIGELPAALQAKLLRAVQFGEIRRVGGVATLKVDVRFVTATNRDIEAAVQDGSFREDLYYRLNVLAIRVPPLRERPEDIEETFSHLVRREGIRCEFGREHFDVLRAYAWPGNVREMENLIERLKIREGFGAPSPAQLSQLMSPGSGEPRPPIRPLADVERDAIEEAMRHCGGDRKRAAEALGISLRTLYYRLASYRGQEPEPEPPA